MDNTQCMTFKPTADMRGFTFVEMLVVLAIFSIAILAVAAMQVMSINTNASARMSGEACALAANQIETLMALPYDHSNLDPDLNPHQVINGAYTFNWNDTLSYIDSDGTNDSKTIIVTVQCANRNAKDVSLQYIKPEV